jgi:hypothetical protein
MEDNSQSRKRKQTRHWQWLTVFLRAQALKELFEKAGIKMSTRTGVKVNEARHNFKSEGTLITALVTASCDDMNDGDSDALTMKWHCHCGRHGKRCSAFQVH